MYALGLNKIIPFGKKSCCWQGHFTYVRLLCGGA